MILLFRRWDTHLKFNRTPEKLPKPKRKGSSSNHHLSGVNSLLNFGGHMWSFPGLLILLDFFLVSNLGIFRLQMNSRKSWFQGCSFEGVWHTLLHLGGGSGRPKNQIDSDHKKQTFALKKRHKIPAWHDCKYFRRKWRALKSSFFSKWEHVFVQKGRVS